MTNQSTYEKAIVGKYAKIARLDFCQFSSFNFFFQRNAALPENILVAPATDICNLVMIFFLPFLNQTRIY